MANKKESFCDVWIVGLDGKYTKCGELLIRGKNLFFRYLTKWLQTGYPIDPLHLPLKEGIFRSVGFSPPLLIFEDTLPDGWGLAILSKQYGLNLYGDNKPYALGLVGTSGVGGLFLTKPGLRNLPKPVWIPESKITYCFDEAEQFEMRKANGIFRYLGITGTSAGGARPKVSIIDKEGIIWLVKFPSQRDPHPSTVALIENAGLIFAKKLGISVPKTRIINLGVNAMALAVQRFDIIPLSSSPYGGRKILMSFSTLTGGMQQVEHGYEIIGKTLRRVSSKPNDDVRSFFRWMLVNWHTVNTDDHLKNFSMLWDGKTIRLSPAYDIVGNLWGMGTHTMPISGKHTNIYSEDLKQAGKEMGLSLQDILDDINQARELAKNYLQKIKNIPGTDALCQKVHHRLSLSIQRQRRVSYENYISR